MELTEAAMMWIDGIEKKIKYMDLSVLIEFPRLPHFAAIPTVVDIFFYEFFPSLL